MEKYITKKNIIIWICVLFLLLFIFFILGIYSVKRKYEQEINNIVEYNKSQEAKYNDIIDQCSLILDYTEKKKIMETKRIEFNQASQEEAQLRTKIKQDLLWENNL